MMRISRPLLAFTATLVLAFSVLAEASTDFSEAAPANTGASVPVKPSMLELPSSAFLIQEGVATSDGAFVNVASQTGKAVFLFQFKAPEPFDTVVLAKASGIPNGNAVFIWKPAGVDFDAASMQVPVVVRDGSIRFPQSLDPVSFDFFGLVVTSSKFRLSDIASRQSTLLDSISDFFQPELVKPSSINLLYGHKIGGIPYVRILGILCILSFLLFMFIKPKWAFASALVCWLLFDFRYSYDQASIISTTSKIFLAPENPAEKRYYDFWNFYGFIDLAKDCLPGDADFYAPSEWPFSGNFSYHLSPRKTVWKGVDSSYVAVYRGGELRDGSLFWNGSELVRNASVVCQFDRDSYIVKRNP